MITGTIAMIILIAVLPPAIAKGEILEIVIAVAIAVILLFIGIAGRECNRAYSNLISYWANREPEQRHRKPLRCMKDSAVRVCPVCGGTIRVKDMRIYQCSNCGRTPREM